MPSISTGLCYPAYDSTGLYQTGPIARIRLGNILKSGGAGITCAITSLDINYDETTWEIIPSVQIPRIVNVSISCQVLHEFAVGISDGMFGGVPAPGAAGDVVLYRDAFSGVGYYNSIPMTGLPGSAAPGPMTAAGLVGGAINSAIASAGQLAPLAATAAVALTNIAPVADVMSMLGAVNIDAPSGIL